MRKRYILFKPGALCISKDSAAKLIVNTILYKDIKNLTMLSMTSFYFTTPDDGFSLFFKDYNSDNAKKWFSYL